ncbi:hypothetical protein [Sphingomonas jeddahensis]|uniref:Uncharacterized protein n=1 Tax=Sphingomonas jeddahensis TaxID=1915074 RepID=A0A1V2ETS1_9SPHN|nr:hypothetical protein [Sphingomonas jeddahensis]ONF95534.1 hypothetical protein SPHI_22010 [Sphingomonas jeddahensis]
MARFMRPVGERHSLTCDLFGETDAAHGARMRKEVSRELIDAVRTALDVAEGLGLSDTSLHLNAALVTLDGKGVAPEPEHSGTLH